MGEMINLMMLIFKSFRMWCFDHQEDLLCLLHTEVSCEVAGFTMAFCTGVEERLDVIAQKNPGPDRHVPQGRSASTATDTKVGWPPWSRLQCVRSLVLGKKAFRFSHRWGEKSCLVRTKKSALSCLVHRTNRGQGQGFWTPKCSCDGSENALGVFAASCRGREAPYNSPRKWWILSNIIS